MMDLYIPICLETAIKFGLSDVACDITAERLESWFEEPPHGFPCEEQCSLSVTLDSDVSVQAKRLQFQVHDDLKRTLNLNNKCPVTNRNKVDVKVVCSPSAFKAYSGLICSEDTECGQHNAYCFTYRDTGRCMCDIGFLLINGDCRKVGLILGEYCDVNEQCTGSANSGTCSMSRCDCRSGYYTSGPNCYPKNAGKGSSAGTVAGVGIGGFVLGVLVSLGIMIVLRKRESRGKQNNDCRKIVVNQSYDKDTEFGESSQISNTTDTKQVSHVRPTIREATYSNIKCSSDNDNGDIYNHLNEKENPGADLDDYDHAHPSTDPGTPDGDYWHLNSKPEREMESQQNADVYDTSGSVDSSDHYFTLENRNVS